MDQEYIDELRKGVLLTNRLSEVHVESFKMYPHIFFDCLKQAEILWDIDTDNQIKKWVVEYNLTFEEGYSPDLLKERANALVNSTRFLLWKEVDVVILIDGKKLDIEALNGSATKEV